MTPEAGEDGENVLIVAPACGPSSATVARPPPKWPSWRGGHRSALDQRNAHHAIEPSEMALISIISSRAIARNRRQASRGAEIMPTAAIIDNADANELTR